MYTINMLLSLHLLFFMQLLTFLTNRAPSTVLRPRALWRISKWRVDIWGMCGKRRLWNMKKKNWYSGDKHSFVLHVYNYYRKSTDNGLDLIFLLVLYFFLSLIFFCFWGSLKNFLFSFVFEVLSSFFCTYVLYILYICIRWGQFWQ